MSVHMDNGKGFLMNFTYSTTVGKEKHPQSLNRNIDFLLGRHKEA